MFQAVVSLLHLNIAYDAVGQGLLNILRRLKFSITKVLDNVYTVQDRLKEESDVRVFKVSYRQ